MSKPKRTPTQRSQDTLIADRYRHLDGRIATQRAGTKTGVGPTVPRMDSIAVTGLGDWLAYVEYSALRWIAEGREQDAKELRAVGYQLLNEIGADNE